MEQIVTGCKDCPLNSNDREYGDACQHPSVWKGEVKERALPEDNNNGYETITPFWCPLKKESITITMQQQSPLT